MGPEFSRGIIKTTACPHLHSPKGLTPRAPRIVVRCTLHFDRDFDAREIDLSLNSNPQVKGNSMSVAEKLKAASRAEGLVAGEDEVSWIGQIQAFKDFFHRRLPQTRFEYDPQSRR
jgi:hypothetical protein